MSETYWKFVCPKCGEKVNKVIGIYIEKSALWFSVGSDGWLNIEDWDLLQRDTVGAADKYECPECGEELIEDEVIGGAEEWADSPEGNAQLLKEE